MILILNRNYIPTNHQPSYFYAVTIKFCLSQSHIVNAEIFYVLMQLDQKNMEELCKLDKALGPAVSLPLLGRLPYQPMVCIC